MVSGYQADIDFTNKFAGILYEEKGRGILAQRGEQTPSMPMVKKRKFDSATRRSLPPPFIQVNGTISESLRTVIICSTSSMKR